jgi:long-chain acyl-CoA synthetase
MPIREEVISNLTASGQFELTVDNVLGYPLRVYKNAPASLRDLFETATPQFEDRIFTIYGDEELTFKAFRAKVASLAHYLLEKGVKKGDRVAVGMRNYPEWIISFWACQAIGAIVVALNAWWITHELEYALEDAQPKVLLLDGERWERVLPLLEKFRDMTAIVARRDNAPAGGIDFAEATAKPAAGLPDADVGPLDIATILYTSGTTGRPKGAFANQRNHITNIWNTLLAGQVSRVMLGVPDDFVAPQGGTLQTFPFFHIGGLTGLYLGTIMGSKMALMYKWNPVEAVDLIEKYGLTSAGGVPIVVRQLLETATAAGKSLSTLVGLSSGGAPVPPDLIRRVETQFEQKAAPANGYGLTETTSAVITNGGADYFAHPNSIGRPVPTCEIRVVDDNGKDVPQGEVGEVWMRGPNIIPGYWGNPEATEAAFGGGWFRSGDLGYLDTDGFYYVVDRKKDVIIRGGENIYCAEVEAALLEHPLIRDATVIGLPNQEYGEIVAAVLQVDPENQGPELQDEIVASLAAKLAKFKIPTTFKITDQDLPRTATGKVLKRDIRAEFFKAEMASV